MNPNEQDRMKALLQQAVPPVDADAEPARDLWPAVLQQLDRRHPQRRSRWFLLDCALLAGLVGMAAVFPAAIPVLLYYL
jgi:hypothetical protein